MNAEIVLSTVLAASTVIYTIINLMLWFESRAIRRQKTTPLVIAYLKSTENHKVRTLNIKNIGEGLAKNVKIKTLKDYKQLGKENLLLSNVGIIKNGFNNFPPQHELSFFIHFMTELKVDEENSFIEIEISYESISKAKFKNIFDLPFNQVVGQNYSNPPETFMGQIPYYLNELNSTIKRTIKEESAE